MKTLLVLCALVSVSLGAFFGSLTKSCNPPSKPYQSDYYPKSSKYKFASKITFRCLPSYVLAAPVQKTCVGGKFVPANNPVCNPVCTATGYKWTRFYDRDDPSATGDHEIRSLMRNPVVCAKPLSIDARVKGTSKDFRSTNEKVEISPTLGLRCLRKNNNNKCADYTVRFCCDVDECAAGTDNCHAHATCQNTEGSFTCTCNPGYTGDGVQCDELAICTATGYKWTRFYDRDDPSATGDHEIRSLMRNPVVCAKPLSIDARVMGTNKDFRSANEKVEISPTLGLRCLRKNNNNKCADYTVRFCCDVDECAAGTDNCHAHATCQNTEGSFTCTCNAGYTGDGVQCDELAVCTATGYKWTRFYDRDDPSATGDHEIRSLMRNPVVCVKPLSIDARVVGTNKDFRSANEKVEISPTLGLRCLRKNNNNKCADYTVRFCCDVDECVAGTDNCHAHATCQNTDGSFTCTCNAGYTGDGVRCDDINECRGVAGFCGTGAVCTNYAGRATCHCPPDTTGNPQVQCVENDACASGTDNCHAQATCQNTPGGFTCTCKSGYNGDGVQCTRNTCPPPTPPENGRISFGSKNSYNVGDRVYFGCDPHYIAIYHGSRFSPYKCGNNGEWQGIQITCEGTCRYKCVLEKQVSGEAPCGCQPSCKKNGTCCADYDEFCTRCSSLCTDKPACKCSNCFGDCCSNYRDTCEFPVNPDPTFSLPRPTFSFLPKTLPTRSYPFSRFTPPGKK